LPVKCLYIAPAATTKPSKSNSYSWLLVCTAILMVTQIIWLSGLPCNWPSTEVPPALVERVEAALDSLALAAQYEGEGRVAELIVGHKVCVCVVLWWGGA
jgi:hypothetical protein